MGIPKDLEGNERPVERSACGMMLSWLSLSCFRRFRRRLLVRSLAVILSSFFFRQANALSSHPYPILLMNVCMCPVIHQERGEIDVVRSQHHARRPVHSRSTIFPQQQNKKPASAHLAICYTYLILHAHHAHLPLSTCYYLY